MAQIHPPRTGATAASRGSRDAGSVATDAAADVVRGEYGGMRFSTRDVLVAAGAVPSGDLAPSGVRVLAAVPHPHGTSVAESPPGSGGRL